MYLLKILKRLTTFSFFLILPFSSSYSAAEFRVKEYTQKNDNGYFQLEWDATKDAVVIVQQALEKSFNTPKNIYEGIDRATFISGLDNGTYYYRVKEVDGKWSNTYQVIVQHQSLQLAFTLFGLGALVFLLTVGVVYRGMKQVTESN